MSGNIGPYNRPLGRGYQVAPVGKVRRTNGMPQQHYPGLLNGHEAAKHRYPVGENPPQPPRISEEQRCYLEYAVQLMCRCVAETFVDISLHAARPEWIDPPLNGICFDRHRGTGDPTSTDPPLTLPAVTPAGPFTEVVVLTVPDFHRGVINTWGVDVTPAPLANAVEWILEIDDRRADPFSTLWGSDAAAAEGGWFGVPFTLANPKRTCIQLRSGQTVRLSARNTTGGPIPPSPVDVAAMICGHIWALTMQAEALTVRGSRTDQR